MILEYEFPVGCYVHIDGCKDLTARVTAVQWRHPDLISYEVSWVANGKSECVLVESWRLYKAEE